VPPTPEARRLLAALRALPLVIDEAAWEVGLVSVPSYPQGARPTATVTLRGRGRNGRGENVAWSEVAHERFRVDEVPLGPWRLGEWAVEMGGRFADPYERAALEAAAIDLALRQEETNLFRLLEVTPAPVRYVVSFEKVADPLERLCAEASHVEVKIDADPAWDDGTYAALAATSRVAVLDFKMAGDAADHERAHRALPRALIEDPGEGPWSASLRRRLSFDIWITSVPALGGLPARPVAINVKPGRMGGVLEALECVARCAEQGIAVYMGGMFEVGVGRGQLRALASIFSPEAPNDIAPLVPPERPARLAVDAAGPGFG
jgi:L-alanine-DL-glutamate epimerase-like enolase superfamily enzyme